MNTYTKLNDGSWGVRVAGEAAKGDAIKVTKKDGSVKCETIKSVLWIGKDSKTGAIISLCSVAQGNGSNGYSSNGNGHGHIPGTGHGRAKYGCRNGQCYCPQCSSGSECLCRCSCGFGG